MLKQDPAIWRLRIESILALLLFSLVLWNFFNNQSDNHASETVKLIVDLFYIGFFLQLLYTIFVRRERYWRRLNRTRQDAAVHKERYLAAKQPTPNGTVFTFPVKITIRPSKLLWIFLCVLGIGPAIVLLIASIVLTIRGQLDIIWFILGVACILALTVLYLLYFESSNNYCPKIVMHDDGLTAYYPLRRVLLRWDEARLFASYHTYGKILSNTFVPIYELSGAHAFVGWSWSILNSPWWTVRVNGQVVDAAYSKLFIKHINQVVMAHTDLPLCELVVTGRKKS